MPKKKPTNQRRPAKPAPAAPSTRAGRASRHYNVARKRDWPATNCDGFVRTLYVRPGGGRWWTRVGAICDGCGAIALDPDWQAAIGESARRARTARAEARSSVGVRGASPG